MSTLLLLLFHIAAASAASITIKEGVAGQVCFVQPLPFASKSYSYTVTVDQASIQLAPGCDASQILLSPLYTSGSCIDPSNNNKAGCPSSDGTTVTGTLSSGGSRVPVNSTTTVCNKVFSTTNSSSGIVPLAGATTYARGTVTCGPSSTAYLFFQNNCPEGPDAASSQTNFTIRVDYSVMYPSCSGIGSGSYYTDYYSNSWSRWPIILGIGIAVFVLIFALLTICGKRRRAQQLQQQQQMMGGPHVQMMPPPPGMGGIATGMPYNGPPAGYPTGSYPIPPPQPPSTGNYVPPPSGTSSTYPSQPINLQPSAGATNTYPQPEGGTQAAIWYAGGKPPS